jgi:NADPH-dependent glutamate synthase beta subunit-like oxidoreductase
MPARAEEVHHARQEGIDFQMLTAPVEFVSDGKGWLTAARCVRMELGEPDASGRRRPVPIQGSEFDLPLSVAIIAIGTSANQTRSCKALRQGWARTSGDTFRRARKRNGLHAKESLPEVTSSLGALL